MKGHQQKKHAWLIFAAYNAAAFFVATLFVLLFFRLFPEKNLWIYLVAPVFGLIFGILSFLPYQSIISKDKG